ncbi:glycosyltransferase family 2 protein [Urbifossiella limnaea]|uniref:Glycosyltransferase EpsE n=1 Tax=Urbifossiella limnaea TaxID=2528023 RepID=A0A517XZW4_9BACT|nr:glycosyltransferase family 2 protein [Urbifossiella limnaea]QDU23055.1 Putative glycosyltransferase EpsE [Urbifossiella limnaea]
MRVSVALCTYNGERFLPAQLASIRGQDRLPDELVACDDGSTDRTVELLRAFAAESPFRVRVEVNPTRLGSSDNFARAVSHCTGSLIALCDQDDVWHPDKLATQEAALAADPGANFAFSDADVVDEHGEPLGYTLWRSIGFGRREQKQFAAGEGFECLLRRYRVTGATLMVRAALRELLLPVPRGWVHDAWFALVLSAVGRGIPVAEPLVHYRRHGGQQVGATLRSVGEEFDAARRLTANGCDAVADRYAAALARLEKLPGVSAERLELLAGKVAFHRKRAWLRRRAWLPARLPGVVGELLRGNYGRYARGVLAAGQDVLLR